MTVKGRGIQVLLNQLITLNVPFKRHMLSLHQWPFDEVDLPDKTVPSFKAQVKLDARC